jgi:hypothetical protein
MRGEVMIEQRKYADGTVISQAFPWGTYRARGTRVMCSDGKVRAVSRISETADTFFSVPAAVRVNGRTVSGYVTMETRSGSSVATENDPLVVKFRRYSYGKNADALPEGAWRTE